MMTIVIITYTLLAVIYIGFGFWFCLMANYSIQILLVHIRLKWRQRKKKKNPGPKQDSSREEESALQLRGTRGTDTRCDHLIPIRNEGQVPSSPESEFNQPNRQFDNYNKSVLQSRIPSKCKEALAKKFRRAQKVNTTTNDVALTIDETDTRQFEENNNGSSRQINNYAPSSYNRQQQEFQLHKECGSRKLVDQHLPSLIDSTDERTYIMGNSNKVQIYCDTANYYVIEEANSCQCFKESKQIKLNQPPNNLFSLCESDVSETQYEQNKAYSEKRERNRISSKYFTSSEINKFQDHSRGHISQQHVISKGIAQNRKEIERKRDDDVPWESIITGELIRFNNMDCDNTNILQTNFTQVYEDSDECVPISGNKAQKSSFTIQLIPLTKQSNGSNQWANSSHLLKRDPDRLQQHKITEKRKEQVNNVNLTEDMELSAEIDAAKNQLTQNQRQKDEGQSAYASNQLENNENIRTIKKNELLKQPFDLKNNFQMVLNELHGSKLFQKRQMFSEDIYENNKSNQSNHRDSGEFPAGGSSGYTADDEYRNVDAGYNEDNGNKYREQIDDAFDECLRCNISEKIENKQDDNEQSLMN